MFCAASSSAANMQSDEGAAFLFNLMKVITTAFFLAFVALMAFAINPVKEVTARITPGLTVIFVHPQKFDAKDEHCIEMKEYDVTMHSESSDSVAVTFTYLSPDPVLVKQVGLSILSGKRCYKPERIFLEPSGKKWKGRMRFYISQDVLAEMSNSETPIELEAVCDDDHHSVFSYSPKRWRDRCVVWKYALEILRLNSGD